MGLDWEAQGVLADFRECQRASQNTDLVFHCTNGNVSAHQMIFAGISPFFTDLMQRFVIGRELFPLDLNISLPEIRREHVEMVVEMVYTGQVRITKRDYRPFREICKLLDLCVPIADYDKFFLNQCDDDEDNGDDDDGDVEDDNDDGEIEDNDDDDDVDIEDDDDGGDIEVDGSNKDDIQFVEHSVSEAQMPKVSIPLHPWSSSRAFVCGDCYAVFPLETDLKKHKKSEHDQTESLTSDSPTSPIVSQPSTVAQLDTRQSSSQHNHTESQASDPPPSPSSIVSEPSKVTPLKARLRSHRSSNRSGNLINPPNDERRVECPDCLHLFAPLTVRKHLVSHLRHQLNEHVTKSKSVSGFLKCELCWFETAFQKNMINHLGLTHDMITKLASEAQIKFLDEGKQLRAEARHSSPKHQSMPRNENTFNKPRTRKRILENGDISETGDNDVDTEVGNVLEDETQALNATPDVSSPSMLTQPNKGATSSIENENIKEVSRAVKCPDCLKLVHVLQVRAHLISHLRTHLNKHLIKTNSVPKRFKCQLCTFETHAPVYMRHHLGVTHEMMMKYSNAAQKKFIADAKILLFPNVPKTLDNHTRAHFLENEDGQVTDATETDSQQNNEMILKCPDCLKNYHRRKAPAHLVSHMRKQLNEFVVTSQTVPKTFKCKLCPYESSPLASTMFRHVGVAHEMVETFANEEQKKFLYGTQTLFPQHASSEHRNLSSKMKEKLKTSKTRNRIEIEMDNALEGAAETESPRPEGLAKSQSVSSPSTQLKTALRPWKRKLTGKKSMFAADGEPSVKCPDCQRNIKPWKAGLHLVSHMREQLDKLMVDGSPPNGLRKCKLCPHKTARAKDMREHLGSTHSMVMKFANEAQTKYLIDARKKAIMQRNARKKNLTI